MCNRKGVWDEGECGPRESGDKPSRHNSTESARQSRDSAVGLIDLSIHRMRVLILIVLLLLKSYWEVLHGPIPYLLLRSAIGNGGGSTSFSF